MNNTMPKTTATDAGLSDEHKKIFAIIVNKSGQIRATKPKVIEGQPHTGKAAYVWRMVAFAVSTNPKHHCMPTTADFDLPFVGRWNFEESKAFEVELKPLENLIVNGVPKEQWHGINRWGRAFGKW